jgi:hypothetical protein
VIPVLDNVTLTSSTAQPAGTTRRTVQFSIIADVRTAGGAS